MPETTVEALEALAYAALQSNGVRYGTRMVHWDISGNCRAPVRMTHYSRKPRFINRPRPFMQVTLEAPCRKCPECLRKRAAMWRFRAIAEIAQAERTWFGTLTARPEEHYRLDLLASGRKANFEFLTDAEKFPWRAKEYGREVTRYLKRLRENSGVPLRYLCVTEIHDGERTSPEMRGRPHVHLLMHEFPGSPIRKSRLEADWHLGYSSWKLVQGVKAAMYICKYISKANDARVRASIDYGRNNDLVS